MKYLAVVLSVLAVGGVGSWLTNQGLSWYNQANIPSFAPGGGVIGTVWTVIYILSAISLILWLSQKSKGQSHSAVVWWFVVNGILNAGWSYLFFFKQQVGLAIVEMLVLEVTVLVLISLMWKRVRWSAILLIPYALWVAFATYLAYSFWVLNK